MQYYLRTGDLTTVGRRERERQNSGQTRDERELGEGLLRGRHARGAVGDIVKHPNSTGEGCEDLHRQGSVGVRFGVEWVGDEQR